MAEKKTKNKRKPSGSSKRARARTAAQLARQEKCFELSVLHGKTTREIAAELKLGRNTIIADLHAEHARRRDENAGRREFESARAVGFYERMIARSLKRADIADTLMANAGSLDDEGKKVEWISDRSLEVAMKARERIDKIIGLDAPEEAQQEIKVVIEGGLPKRPVCPQ